MAFFNPGYDSDELRRGTQAGAEIADRAMGVNNGSANNSSAAAQIAQSEGLTKPLSNENEDKGSAVSASNLGVSEAAGAGASGSGASEDTEGVAGKMGLLIAAAEIAEGKANSKNTRRLLGAGIIGVVLLLVSVFGTAAFVEKELAWVGKVVKKYEDDLVNRFTKDEDKFLLKAIINRAKNKAAAEADAKAKPDEPLAQEVDKFPLEDYAHEFEANGFKLTFDPKTGNLLKMIDPAGKDITGGDISTSDFVTIEQHVLPSDSIGQLAGYDTSVVFDDGAVLDPFPPNTDETPDKVNEALAGDVMDGASGAELAGAEASVSEEPPPDGSQPTPAETQAAQTAADANTDLGKALKTADSVMAKTNDAGAAIAAGTSSWVGSTGKVGANLLGPLTGLCEVEHAAQIAADAQQIQKEVRLVREGATIAATLDQSNGKVTAKTYKVLLSMFLGKHGAKNADGSASQDSLPYWRSATWLKATGKTSKIPYANDVSSSAIPLKSGGTQLVDTIQGIMNKTGGAFTCKALTSTWGTIIQGAVGIGQFFASIATFSLSQAAILGANVGFQETLTYVVIPAILQYFTGFSITGTENTVGKMNNFGLGRNLGMNEDYSRSIGGLPQTPAAVNSFGVTAAKEDVADAAAQPLSYRLFSLDNRYSLATAFMSNMPLDATSILGSASNFFTTVPTTLFHSFATLLNPRVAFADTSVAYDDTVYGDGLTQYIGVIGKYDSLANEDYLYAPLNVEGKTIRRIDALGKLTDFPNNSVTDNSTSDLYHCFTNSFAMLAPNSTGNPANVVCKSIGQIETPTVDLPNDSDIAGIYCNYAGSPGSGCVNDILPKLNEDLLHYSQYLTDTNLGAYNNLVPSHKKG